MSYAAQYHAELWLRTPRSDEEIRAEIERARREAEAASDRASRMGGDDSFGWQRIAHQARTAIKVYETELARRSP